MSNMTIRYRAFYSLKVEECGFSTLYAYPHVIQSQLAVGLSGFHGVYHTLVSFEQIEGMKEGIDRVVLVDFKQFHHIPRILRYFAARSEGMVLDNGNLVILMPKNPQYHVIARRSPWVRKKSLDTAAAAVL